MSPVLDAKIIAAAKKVPLLEEVRRVLYEEDDWVVFEWSISTPSAIILTHYCSNNAPDQYRMFPDESGSPCLVCSAIAPESVQAVFQLLYRWG